MLRNNDESPAHLSPRVERAMNRRLGAPASLVGCALARARARVVALGVTASHAATRGDAGETRARAAVALADATLAHDAAAAAAASPRERELNAPAVRVLRAMIQLVHDSQLAGRGGGATVGHERWVFERVASACANVALGGLPIREVDAMHDAAVKLTTALATRTAHLALIVLQGASL